LFGGTLVEDEENYLGTLKGNLVRMHVNNNLLAFIIAIREKRLGYKPPNYKTQKYIYLLTRMILKGALEIILYNRDISKIKD